MRPEQPSRHVRSIRLNLPTLLLITLTSALLSGVASGQMATTGKVTTRTYTTGALPPGDGGDLIISTGTVTVHQGKYKYRNVNIYGGGTLLFADEPGGTDFWAQSILIEAKGSLIAGTAAAPMGTMKGVVTIHLWGAAQATTGAGGQGITCMASATCGVPSELWSSNPISMINPTSCTLAKDVQGYNQNLPGNVNDCFYGYEPIQYDGGGTTPGFFGYKVLAVSYDGTLQLFGKKGASPDPQKPSSSGTSWARLNASIIPTATTLVLDRAVDWQDGDQIVVTTTDYVASHSEQLTITDISLDKKTITFTRVGNACTGTGVCYHHFGQTYDLSAVTAGIGPEQDPNLTCSGTQTRCVETRAAVGLLSRSIKIVSGGDTLLSDFPAVDPNCGAPPQTPCYYFGGHTIIRQGFASVQMRGVEFHQLGQGGRIAHYPVHFHMARKTPQPASPTDPPVTFVEDSSVWDSMTRWITIHATQGVSLERNVGYMSIGHGFYLEDATETDNKLYSNLGILARAAVINPQNPRQVPGILAAPYPNPIPPPPPKPGLPQEAVPYHSDIYHPTTFWITNGWNDFQYNVAAGTGSCGACYWLVPAANSTFSRYEKWLSYASEQAWGQNPKNPKERAAMTPLENFEGNSCTSAMNGFNTIGDTAPCFGVVRYNPSDFPRMEPVTAGNLSPDPYTNPAQADAYYPQVDTSGGRFGTQCPGGDNADCSTVTRCAAGAESNCTITAIDHFTTSFNYTETNFAAMWLRPLWYLVSNSAITDVQNGGLTFVTGGGYTQADVIPGHWAIARNTVFVGNTQPSVGNPFASNAGPFNPRTLAVDPTFTCATQHNASTGSYCLNANAGITMLFASFGVNQRMFNIYDGPAYEENNAFLDVTRTNITDCTPQAQGGCSNSKWMYGAINGMPQDAKGACYLPNAAIGWKQPNGFFYPPTFHSDNLMFKNVDIRHFVIEPLMLPGTYNTDDSEVKKRYCTYGLSNPEGQGGLFTGYTDIDRQTELSDDDGTLTGLINTISVNKDPFFAAPVEDIECASDVSSNLPPVCDKSSPICGTAKTSPYNYVSTVVYPDCGDNCPPLPQTAPDYLHEWAVACSFPECFGVPLYRQDLNPGEQGTHPSIKMAGQAVAQRSTLTVNHGSYYMDTTVSEAKQRAFANNAYINLFQGGHTYYTFLLFAKPKPEDPTKQPAATKQTYTLYVGDGFNPATDLNAVQMNIANAPFVPKNVDWPWGTKPTVVNGMITVTMDMSFDEFKTNYDKVGEEHCQPATFCSWNSSNSTCGCALNSEDHLFTQCQAVCSKWTQIDVDCPDGGCYGFSVALPATFMANNQGQQPTPQCYPDNSDWNVDFNPLTDQTKAGTCYYKTVPKGNFCTNLIPDIASLHR
jgi:hypothetical protein